MKSDLVSEQILKDLISVVREVIMKCNVLKNKLESVRSLGANIEGIDVDSILNRLYDYYFDLNCALKLDGDLPTMDMDEIEKMLSKIIEWGEIIANFEVNEFDEENTMKKSIKNYSN